MTNKTAVIYSSLTGNSEAVARTLATHFKGDLYSVKEHCPLVQYENFLVCCWTDQGAPDKQAQNFLKTLKDKTVGLVATMGVFPDSDHAKSVLQKGEQLLEPSNKILGSIACMGKIDPNLLARMEVMMAGNHAYLRNPDRLKRIEEAKKHPNEDDYRRICNYFNAALSAVEV